jgi:hypothetical protein
MEDEDFPVEDGNEEEEEGEDMAYYNEVKRRNEAEYARARAKKKAEKLRKKNDPEKLAREAAFGKAGFSGALLDPKEPDQLHEDGRRKAHKRILKNRGLTRIRNKKDRTPHLRNRRKYERATKKRRHMVAEYHGSNQAGYSGEKTGIKDTLVRSTKFKN